MCCQMNVDEFIVCVVSHFVVWYGATQYGVIVRIGCLVFCCAALRCIARCGMGWRVDSRLLRSSCAQLTLALVLYCVVLRSTL